MKYGSVVVQQMRNQLLRIDRCALRKLIQRNPAEVQIDSFPAQIIPAMEYAVQRDAVVRQRYLIIQAELVARLIAPREEDFTDCQKAADFDGSMQFFRVFPLEACSSSVYSRFSVSSVVSIAAI